MFLSGVQIVAARSVCWLAPLRPAFLAEQSPIWQQEILPADRSYRPETGATDSSQVNFALPRTRHASSRDKAVHGRPPAAPWAVSRRDLKRSSPALGNFLQTGRVVPSGTR